MNFSLFGWGYVIPAVDFHYLKKRISLNDYAYIRENYVIQLSSGEYLFGMIINSVYPEEESVCGYIDDFKVERTDPLRLKIIQAYTNIIYPILQKENKPKYVLAMAAEWEEESL